jgi:hypothetical protein
MKEIPKDILELCERIEKATVGYDVYLAGGFLRDLEYGNNTPKDVDLFFVPNGVEGLKHSPVWETWMPLPVYDYCNPTQDMKDRGVNRVVCFVNYQLSTPEVNYIVYDYGMSMEELARDFDMGINQIAYDIKNKTFYRSDKYVEHHEQQVIECLHKFSHERTWQRYQRMKAKFPDYQVIGEPTVSALEKLLYTCSLNVKSRASSASA